ncbi:MAG TPA: hypothetical protein VM012_04300 [Flavitalea sp.]|nr:hypothetical protein [Flavitalea sp.]
MKTYYLFILALFIVPASMAQLITKAKCPDFEVDILDGKVNGHRPDIPNDRLKIVLPCFTSSTDKKDSSKCGTTVFFKDRDVYFYTERNYIELGPKFKGKLSVPLMGVSRNNLFQYLGNPRIKDDKWSAFQTSYGIIILYFDNANKVNKIQISTKGIDTINLCQ